MPNYEELLQQCYGKPPAQAIALAIEIYKDVGKLAEDIRARAKRLIEEISIETGQLEWKTEEGQVTYPKPSVSVSYDRKALDALCASDPELKAKLWPHRRETEKAGSMTIK